MSLISNRHHHAQLATQRISPCSYLAKKKKKKKKKKGWSEESPMMKSGTCSLSRSF
jgi:hypothetical protein